jgi:hypothetical protein
MIGDPPGAKRLLHTQDRRSTGNPVYNGASNAATFGTVDPAGYADRERRAGLAKSILQGGLSGSGGVDPSQLVGETASQTDRADLIRRLSARMAQQRRRG